MSFKAKTVLNKDIRIFRHNVESMDKAYEALVNFVKEKYQLQVPFHLQYEDDEKDLVTIASGEDFEDAYNLAQESSSVLKIFIVPKGLQEELNQNNDMMANSNTNNNNMDEDYIIDEDIILPYVQQEILQEQKEQDEGIQGNQSSSQQQQQGQGQEQNNNKNKEETQSASKELLNELINNEEFRNEFINFITTFLVSIQEDKNKLMNEAFEESLLTHEIIAQHSSIKKFAEIFPILLIQYQPYLSFLYNIDPENISHWITNIIEMYCNKNPNSNSNLNSNRNGLNLNGLPPFVQMMLMNWLNPYSMNYSNYGYPQGPLPPPPPPPPPHPHHRPHGLFGHGPHGPHQQFNGPLPHGPFGYFHQGGHPPPPPPSAHDHSHPYSYGNSHKNPFFGLNNNNYNPYFNYYDQNNNNLESQVPLEQEIGQVEEQQQQQKEEQNNNNNNSNMEMINEENENEKNKMEEDYKVEIIRDDLTLSDNAYVLAGQVVVKTWRIKNNGKKDWPNNMKLKYNGKAFNPIVNGVEFNVSSLKINEESDVSIMIETQNIEINYNEQQEIALFNLILPNGNIVNGGDFIIRVLIVHEQQKEDNHNNNNNPINNDDNDLDMDIDEDEDQQQEQQGINDNNNNENEQIKEINNYKYEEELTQIMDLGFDDVDKIRNLLDQHHGNMDVVINILYS